MSETSQPSSENDSNKIQRPRGSHKRQVHNEIERRRKDKINNWISKIGELLPCKELHNQSKISILEQTVDYIKLLASERDKLLSENCLEVHAEEIKKLKRDNKFLSEQNAIYEKLLEQSNISLKHLPKKVLKYSNKLIRKNGVLTVKNAESNVSTQVDTGIQVSNMCLNVAASTAGITESNSPPKESFMTSSKGTAENCKPSSRSSNDSKPVKSSSSTTTNSVIKSSAPVITNPCNSIVNPPLLAPTVQSSNNVAKENIIPVINWNDPARNSASFHAGGVTTVLSQFPVMSTNQRSTISNICNKNVSTVIIPSGGSLVQQSNTISVICPSTLPIFVSQQVFNVPSVARNVGLQPTIICPGPLDNQTSQVDKSALNGTLLTLNSNSMVPISSSFPTNTRIILPPQPAVLGNTCGNINLTQNFIMPAVSQAQSDNLIVPLIPKQSVSSSIKRNDTVNSNFTKQSSAKIDNKETKSLENDCKSNNTTSVVLPENSLKEIENSVKNSAQNNNKKSIQDLRNVCSNSPPSLLVLSANKMISLAHQYQKVKTDIILTLNNQIAEKVTPQPLSKIISVSSEDNFSLQPAIESKSIHKDVNQPLESNSKQKTASSTVSQTTESTIAKSGFSLTVLMGDSFAEKNSQSTEVSETGQKSLPENKVVQNDKSQTQSGKFTTHTTVGSTSCSNIPECSIVTVSSVVKQHVFSSTQTNAFSNSESGKISVSNIKKFDSQSLSNKITSCSSNNSTLPVSSTGMNKNNSCNFNNTSASSTAANLSHSISYNLDPNNVTSKQALQNMTLSSKNEMQPLKSVIAVQSDQNQSNMSSEIISTVNSTCNENVPYSITESSVNQSLLPSLFSSNHMVGLNSPILVCHTGHDNMNGILLSSSIQVSSDATSQNLNPCLISDPNSDFHTFSVGNRDLILQNSASGDHNKKIPETVSTFSANSGIGTVVTNNSETAVESEKDKIENTSDDNCNKEFSTQKKKSKVIDKECSEKTVTNDDITSEISSNAGLNGNQAADNVSLTKNDSSGLIRQESNHFIFTSDILARATESIFGNDILEGSAISKRNADCLSDESSNESSNLYVPLSASEKAVDSSYKLQYSCIREDHNSDISSEKNKKNNATGISQHPNVANSPSLQSKERNVLELNPKQNKLCKVRKSKAPGDSEPPCKKMKEISQIPEKSSNVPNFSPPHEADKGDKNLSNVHPNLSFLEKQVSSPSQHSMEGQNGVGESIGNFPNQVQLTENNCKTPSSVDTIFSLTPMLGDILKDVSHNTNLDSRSTNFLMGNENQNVFSSEKSLISYNYSNNANEDYLNLPRMYFPILPEISSAPVVHVTNVSFAHSVSLCSTQSDSQKSTETHSSTDSQNKSNPKKKDIPPLFHNNNNILNLDMTASNNVPKQSECVLKVSNSDTQFNNTSAKGANNSVHFDSQHSNALSHNVNTASSANLLVSQSSSQYGSRDNFIPPASHPISFYPTICSSSNVQNFSCTTSSLPHLNYHNNSSSMGSVPVLFQTSGNTSNSFNSQSALSKPDSLSHSLCSLLKENSNVENRGSNETASQNTSSSSNIIQSKYSALSLISDQTYSESVSATTCHPQFVQTSAVYTTSASDGQYTSTVSSCRNPKTSLSYSAESLLQTPCFNNEKNKSKNNNNRFPLRTTEKKVDRNNITNMHSMGETNIFMPVTNCDINIQTAPLVALPPVTSFHNFPSGYTICETVPSTTIFNSSARTQDIPLSLSNDNFLNHMNLNVDSQMLSNRHEVSPTVPKPHSNIPLSFEYNNCNFLPHVKPTLEASRSSDTSACFQSSTYSNNYTQQSQQKTNCCNFSHRAVATNSDLPSDINLPTPVTVASFHNEKNNFQTNRTSLQTSFSQNNSNFMGNFFYSSPTNCRDGNDMNMKPSTNRASQEMYVPDGVRQNIHDQSVVFNSRKTVPSSRTKSKKPKNTTSNENNSSVATCITNYSTSQDNSCNKSNLSYIPNGYFKSSSHPVLPPPGQLQCSQNKISEAVPPSVIPANPSFNSVLHQQGDNFLNLNFQHSNFTMSPLPRPPTQPLSCSCLTTPIISHTFSSSSGHPVPSFNLSNILPDMGCSGNQVSFSPTKFPANHPSSTQCQTNPTITNSAHIVSHQSCAPSLYPPHPPMVRGTLNPILGHNSQSLIDSQVSVVGTAGAVMSQNTTFTATQNPTFRNVMHSITFPRNDH